MPIRCDAAAFLRRDAPSCASARMVASEIVGMSRQQKCSEFWFFSTTKVWGVVQAPISHTNPMLLLARLLPPPRPSTSTRQHSRPQVPYSPGWPPSQRPSSTSSCGPVTSGTTHRATPASNSDAVHDCWQHPFNPLVHHRPPPRTHTSARWSVPCSLPTSLAKTRASLPQRASLKQCCTSIDKVSRMTTSRCAW